MVWINGDPKGWKKYIYGGFSELNAEGGEISIGENCDIASFVVINVADSHLKTIGLKKILNMEKFLLETMYLLELNLQSWKM